MCSMLRRICLMMLSQLHRQSDSVFVQGASRAPIKGARKGERVDDQSHLALLDWSLAGKEGRAGAQWIASEGQRDLRDSTGFLINLGRALQVVFSFIGYYLPCSSKR